MPGSSPNDVPLPEATTAAPADLAPAPLVEDDTPPNIRYFPTVRPTPIALLVLPDVLNLRWWVETCGFQTVLDRDFGLAAGDANYYDTEITYPHLRNCPTVAYVYVGWHGQVRFRHRATGHDIVTRPQAAVVERNWPEYGRRFVVGATYMWVHARVELVPQWALPDLAHLAGYEAWGTLLGRMSTLAPPDEEPAWLRPRLAEAGLVVAHLHT